MPAAPLPSSIAAALSMDSPPAACCVTAACCAAACCAAACCCAICNCCGVKPCMLPAACCALPAARPCLLQRAAAARCAPRPCCWCDIPQTKARSERNSHFDKEKDKSATLALLSQELRHLPPIPSSAGASPPPAPPAPSRCSSAAGRPTRTARAWAPPWADRGRRCRGRHRAWLHTRRPRLRRRRRACTAESPPRRAHTQYRGRARRARGRCTPHLVRVRVGVRVHHVAGQPPDEEKAHPHRVHRRRGQF